jgi:hypothetical protein
MTKTELQNEQNEILREILLQLTGVSHQLGRLMQEAQSDIIAEADSCSQMRNAKTGGQRNRTRIPTTVETKGCIPEVVLLLRQGLTYSQVAEEMEKRGRPVSRSAIGRFRKEHLQCAEIVGDELRVTLKSGNVYKYSISSLKMLESKGRY